MMIWLTQWLRWWKHDGQPDMILGETWVIDGVGKIIWPNLLQNHPTWLQIDTSELSPWIENARC